MLRVSDQTPDGAMEPQPETDFPATLSRWVQEIVLSIPGPARSTLAELIVGAMLAQGGPVTRAVLALPPRPGRAGRPLDAGARPLPVARPGCRPVRHRPARDLRAATLRHHRRHTGAALLGQGARRCCAV